MEATERLSRERDDNQVDREKKELENTYFLNSNNTARPRETKANLFKFAPWGIVLLIFSLVFLLINMKEKINIEITVSKKALTAEYARKAGWLASREWRGVFDKEIINNFRFHGGLKPNSRLADGYLILVTAGKPDWAYLSVDFTRPIDFSKNSLIFSARGDKGEEELKIKLTDVNMRTFEPGALPVMVLADKWQTRVINLSSLDYNPDETKICRATFIVSSRLTSNKAGTTIYLKDIAIAKNGH